MCVAVLTRTPNVKLFWAFFRCVLSLVLVVRSRSSSNVMGFCVL